MIDIDEKIQYYLGDTNYGDIEPDPNEVNLWYVTGPEVQSNYYEDTQRLFSLSKSAGLWFKNCDERYLGPPYPVLTKTREIDNTESKGILAPLNYLRHFGSVDEVSKADRPWEKKKDNIIWRGATTGIRRKSGRKVDRYDIVSRYFSKYDFGFTSYAGKWSKDNKKDISRYFKQPLHPLNQSEYKYILVIDGNDKSSSLSWILASNSIPIMPKPRFHSWLCEAFLLPNIHYVEIKDDYSDLEEKIQWCIKNDDVCESISKNGAMFMRDNFNRNVQKQSEELLINEIDKIYSNIGV